MTTSSRGLPMRRIDAQLYRRICDIRYGLQPFHRLHMVERRDQENRLYSKLLEPMRAYVDDLCSHIVASWKKLPLVG